jgi:hypothetical protein
MVRGVLRNSRRMKEVAEREIKIGLRRTAKAVVDEIEQTAKEMAMQKWKLVNTTTDEVLGSIFLFFEREITK